MTAAGTHAASRPAPRPGAIERARTRVTLFAASAGHLGADFTQGAIPAMLPFLREHRGYSYSQGTALVLAMSLGASLAQPPFGHLVDRRRLPYLAPAGVLVAALCVGLIGFLPGYWLLFAVALVGGLGVAAFHPEGARTAARSSGERRAAGMSVFAVGGNLGFALAPAVVAGALAIAGLHGTAIVAVVPLAGASFLAYVLTRRRAALARAEEQVRRLVAGEDRWGAFWRLAVSACLRSGVYFGLQTFVPAYFVAHFGASAAAGDAALTVLLVAGVLGTIAGGQLAERIGRRRVLLGSLVLIAPLLLLALAVGEWLAYPVLALVGFVTIANMSVTVVMGQEYLPNRLGTASGVMLGLVISVGGGIVAALGPLADATSARTVLFGLCVLPIVSLLLVFRLPESRRV